MFLECLVNKDVIGQPLTDVPPLSLSHTMSWSACFFKIRLLAKTKSYLSFKDLERVINAFVTSRLDYYNALYVGMDQASIKRLQLVQNAAAHLLTGHKKRDHITPILASRHWLPVRFRIDF